MKFVRNNFLLCCAGFFLVSAIILSVVIFSRNADLKIIFLDVGQGDATMITTPMGKQILIDTGAKGTISQKIAKYMPVSDHSLDMLILTHPDLDHVGGGLSIINNYEVDVLLHSGLLAGAPMYEAFAERSTQLGIPAITAQAGQKIELEPDLYLQVMSPYPGLDTMEPNDFSVVMRLVYGDTSALLMGDATKFIETDMVNMYGDIIQSDILKVGHHGSQTSTSEDFVGVVNPQYGVISASCNNNFGHPHGSVLATLFKAGVEVLGTCEEGDIVFTSNGERFKKNE